MKTKTFFITLLMFIIPMSAMAQEVFKETIITSKSKDAFIEAFKKNIAIDKEDFNIYIDYIDESKNTLIFSGRAKGMGRLKSCSSNVLTDEIDFKIKLSYKHDSKNFILEPQKLVLTYKAGSTRDFSFMPTDILRELREELIIVEVYGPDFEVNSYFMERLKEYKEQAEKYLAQSENMELKKKERKKAKREYENISVKYKVYNDVHSAISQFLTRLKLYYFYE